MCFIYSNTLCLIMNTIIKNGVVDFFIKTFYILYFYIFYVILHKYINNQILNRCLNTSKLTNFKKDKNKIIIHDLKGMHYQSTIFSN